MTRVRANKHVITNKKPSGTGSGVVGDQKPDETLGPETKPEIKPETKTTPIRTNPGVGNKKPVTTNPSGPDNRLKALKTIKDQNRSRTGFVNVKDFFANSKQDANTVSNALKNQVTRLGDQASATVGEVGDQAAAAVKPYQDPNYTANIKNQATGIAGQNTISDEDITRGAELTQGKFDGPSRLEFGDAQHEINEAKRLGKGYGAGTEQELLQRASSKSSRPYSARHAAYDSQLYRLHGDVNADRKQVLKNIADRGLDTQIQDLRDRYEGEEGELALAKKTAEDAASEAQTIFDTASTKFGTTLDDRLGDAQEALRLRNLALDTALSQDPTRFRTMIEDLDMSARIRQIQNSGLSTQEKNRRINEFRQRQADAQQNFSTLYQNFGHGMTPEQFAHIIDSSSLNFSHRDVPYTTTPGAQIAGDRFGPLGEYLDRVSARNYFTRGKGVDLSHIGQTSTQEELNRLLALQRLAGLSPEEQTLEETAGPEHKFRKDDWMSELAKGGEVIHWKDWSGRPIAEEVDLSFGGGGPTPQEVQTYRKAIEESRRRGETQPGNGLPDWLRARLGLSTRQY